MRVLLAIAEAERRRRIGTLVGTRGHPYDVAVDGQAALRTLAASPYDILILDLALPGVGGLGVLRALPSLDTRTQIIVIAADPCVDCAVEAMKLGARDVITCPCDGEYLSLVLARTVDEVRMRRELAAARSDRRRRRASGIVGESVAIQRVFALMDQVAPTRATVLITGETGTGKDLVARGIHDASPRRERPFVVVNCSAIPETLLESELFGHTRGSFTGAIQSRKGLIEEADGGTLFLDEIGTVPPDTQVKLLRVIEERRLQRVGANASTAVDFRLISATNESLPDLVRQGRFRQDLYFRLNVFPIRVPPLRERKEDIPRLAHHFLARYAKEYERDPPELTARCLSRLMAHSWPGNIRELQNLIERAVVLRTDGGLCPELLPSGADPWTEAVLSEALEGHWTLEHLEREYILAVLERNDGKRSAAASELGVNRRTIHRKLSRYRCEGLLPG